MRAAWIETPSGAITRNSDSGPMSAGCINSPRRARHAHPSGCHIGVLLEAALLCLSHSLVSIVTLADFTTWDNPLYRRCLVAKQVRDPGGLHGQPSPIRPWVEHDVGQRVSRLPRLLAG